MGKKDKTRIYYMEWNIHGAGGFNNYKMPDFVSKAILSEHPDVFVLVEYYAPEDEHQLFKKKLEDTYDLYVSPFHDSYNQVCIGIRNSLQYSVLEVVPNQNDKNTDYQNDEIPEYLRIDTLIAGKEVSIFGTRIKTQRKKKDEQFDWLKKEVEKRDCVLCLGDFNCGISAVQKKIKSNKQPPACVYGPRISNGYYSFVHKNKNKVGIDWLIVKGISKDIHPSNPYDNHVENPYDNHVENPYDDHDKSPYASYDWGFVNAKNGYGEKTKDDYLDLHSLPDHAILKGTITISL